MDSDYNDNENITYIRCAQRAREGGARPYMPGWHIRSKHLCKWCSKWTCGEEDNSWIKLYGRGESTAKAISLHLDGINGYSSWIWTRRNSLFQEK